jgi:putative ABC transport system permease protein
MLAGGLGIALASAGLVGLTVLQPANLPRLDEVRLDGSVLMFTLVVSLVTGVAFGLIPAIYASNPDLNASLKKSGRGTSDGVHRQRARNVLVVSEVALAMVLLAGAGLLINSFARLARVDPGFQPEHLMTFDFSPAGRAYDADSRRMNLVRQLRDQLQAKPGVVSAATVYGLPFGTMLNSLVALKIEKSAEPAESVRAGWRVVSPNYFEAIGATLLAGRAFSEKLDAEGTMPVTIINEAFQQKYFPNEDSVGMRIQPFTVSTNWHEIVGVVRVVKLTGLDVHAATEI